MDKIRVLLADDHAVLRAGLSMLLNAQPDMEVVGEASDGKEALQRTQELAPDVVLLDITMPGLGGIQATRLIKANMPKAAVLILTMHEDQGYLREVLQAGASGYIPKKAAEAELVSAIRAVYQGGIFLYPSLAKGLVEELIPGRVDDQKWRGNSYGELSEREREVLQLVARGYTNQQIADVLFVSVKTVETYRARVMEKLNVRNRVELVRYTLQKGLLTNNE